MLAGNHILFLVFMHVFRVMVRVENVIGAIFMRYTVCVDGRLWPAPLLLGVYCVSTTNNVGALTGVVGSSFVATAHKGAQYRVPHDVHPSPPA